MGQPLSDPPADSYADVVQFDQPIAYYPMNDPAASLTEQAVIGPGITVDPFVGTAHMSAFTDGAINGDNPSPYSALGLAATEVLTSETIEATQSIDFRGLTEATVDFWLKTDSVAPASPNTVLVGVGGQWYFQITTTGALTFTAVNGAATSFTATSPGISAGVWMHVAGVVASSTTSLYVNGALAATAGFSGGFHSGGLMQLTVGSAGSVISSVYYDELAIYRYALTAGRIAAHYTAGVNRGYARGQLAGERIGRTLDAVQNHTPRYLQAGTRELAGSWTGDGKPTLEVLREAKNAEAVDAFTFIASDGTVTFLDAGHRSMSPWNTVQAVFGDAGGELDYMDIQLDYSDSFIANTWNVTRDGGTTQTTSDAASITTYLERPQSLTGLKLRDDTDAQDVANEMTAKYAQPFTRVLSITPKTMNTDVLDAVFRLELGDRIMVRNRARTGISSTFPSATTYPSAATYPGPLMFEQTLFVQSITVDASPAAVFPTVKLGVSPV